MENRIEKEIIFSGMQPTAMPHLGNYLGAIKNWVKLYEQYNCLFCVVDMHSITIKQEPAVLRKNCRDLLMLYIACGLDPEKNIIYYQSHVPAHAEMSWILNCYTYIGELNRMTQFKDKAKKFDTNINVGLFDYPVLMAADILLYQAGLVPVGEDQRQHLELTRDIAIRFNNIYGDVFKVPEPYIPKIGSRIMGLADPTKKMSKSDTENANNVIFLLDEPRVAANKIKKAVTDSDNEIRYTTEKPGIKNLIDIYMSITGKSINESEKDFTGMGYGAFKSLIADVVVEEVKGIQTKYLELSNNKDYIDNIIKVNSEKANYLAGKTLNKVKRKIGFPAK
jgi:tryptophanyl-tRNA synthetase